MFETCGRIFAAGLPGCGLFKASLQRWLEFFGEK
jgi:hypothetical protein